MTRRGIRGRLTGDKERDGGTVTGGKEKDLIRGKPKVDKERNGLREKWDTRNTNR